MDCVYRAHCDYMHYLRSPCGIIDRVTYRILKVFTHGLKRQYTFGGVVPWMIEMMSISHGYKIGNIEHSIFTKEHYLASADSKIQATIVENTNYGKLVDKFMLYPAIHLMLDDQHALFWNGNLNSRHQVMAIQLVNY